ncbi:MAG: ABC transporter ATP-binding protein, partial [Deltaproteobacteria bacterium]
MGPRDLPRRLVEGPAHGGGREPRGLEAPPQRALRGAAHPGLAALSPRLRPRRRGRAPLPGAGGHGRRGGARSRQPRRHRRRERPPRADPERCPRHRGGAHCAPPARRGARRAAGARRLSTGLLMGSTVRLVRKILGRLVPYRWLCASALVQVLLIGVFELAKPWPLKVIVDDVLGGRPLGWPGLGTLGGPALLALACLALVAIYALLGVLSVTSNYATIKVGQQMVNDFRSELYAHLQRLSLAFHSRRQVGDLLYRLTADTFAIQTLTMNGFFPVVTSVVLLVGMLAVMLRLDWVLTLIALAIVPLLFLAIAGLSRRMTALATDARTKESALWAIAQRTMSAIRVIQAFTTEEDEHRRFVASSSASLAANLRLYTFQTVYSAFVNVLVAAGTAAVLWFGAMHVLAGKLTVGEIL